MGLYDSRECAGLPEISADPKDWPREHFVPSGGGYPAREKLVFPSLAAAQEVAAREGKDVYSCGYCGELHIGSRRPVVIRTGLV